MKKIVFIFVVFAGCVTTKHTSESLREISPISCEFNFSYLGNGEKDKIINAINGLGTNVSVTMDENGGMVRFTVPTLETINLLHSKLLEMNGEKETALNTFSPFFSISYSGVRGNIIPNASITLSATPGSTVYYRIGDQENHFLMDESGSRTIQVAQGGPNFVYEKVVNGAVHACYKIDRSTPGSSPILISESQYNQGR